MQMLRRHKRTFPLGKTGKYRQHLKCSKPQPQKPDAHDQNMTFKTKTKTKTCTFETKNMAENFVLETASRPRPRFRDAIIAGGFRQ